MRTAFYVLLTAGAGLSLALAPPASRAGKTVDPDTVSRPAGTSLPASNLADPVLVAKGEALFDSLQLSENGLTCKSCHYKFEAYTETFLKPYPHAVDMAAKRAGLDQVDADEMVQLCLVVTMDSKTLAWDSEDLAALTAYVLQQQRDFQASSGAPDQ